MEVLLLFWCSQLHDDGIAPLTSVGRRRPSSSPGFPSLVNGFPLAGRHFLASTSSTTPTATSLGLKLGVLFRPPWYWYRVMFAYGDNLQRLLRLRLLHLTCAWTGASSSALRGTGAASCSPTATTFNVYWRLRLLHLCLETRVEVINGLLAFVSSCFAWGRLCVCCVAL